MAEIKQEKFVYPKKTVFIPRAADGEESFVVVSVNGRRTQVARGVAVEVPYPVYAALREQQVAMDKAAAFREQKLSGR